MGGHDGFNTVGKSELARMPIRLPGLIILNEYSKDSESSGDRLYGEDRAIIETCFFDDIPVTVIAQQRGAIPRRISQEIFPCLIPKDIGRRLDL